MYGPRSRRRVAVSPLRRFEFLVFLVPICFFLLAFLALAMSLVPAAAPHRSSVTLAKQSARGAGSRLLGASADAQFVARAASLLCGHPMHGVSSAAWSVYCVSASSRWRCVWSGEWLPSAAAVNDDYCDCADGSDEVGTSACAGRERSEARFTCRTQQNTTLPLSRVNDRICDCCDGSVHNARSASRATQCEADQCAQRQTRANSLLTPQLCALACGKWDIGGLR